MSKIKKRYKLQKETLVEETENGTCIKNQYYATFRDGMGILRTTPVSYEVAKAISVEFVRKEETLKKQSQRHIDYWGMVDEISDNRSNLEETVMSSILQKELEAIIESLSEKQKRRFNLYYFQKLTYREIAKQENCDEKAIRDSVLLAKRNIKIKLVDLINDTKL